MSSTKIPPYVLLELPEITESVYYPIKNIQRVKYTCFDVSKKLITFGATSGGIYVFNRNPCEFIQLIPNKDGAVTRISISPDEKNIAFANGKGVVTVTECNQSLTSGPFVVTSKEHQGNEVTTMVWSGHNLFTGDDVGKVSVLQMQGFIAKTMFHNSPQSIMSLDSRICQLDVKDCMLLVSTYTRCYICDISQEQYRQIGLKLRDGEFGACFMNKLNNAQSSTNEITQEIAEVKKYNIVDDDAKFAVGKGLENTLIYCARPSSRLWEATIAGTVKRTHQFKQVLAAKPLKSTTVECYNNEISNFENGSFDSEGQSVNFSKIFNVKGTIFSFKKDALFFLDIQDEDKTVWSDSYKDIVDCKFYNDYLYLWLGNSTLITVRFLKIDKFLVQCFVDEKYLLCGKLCALFKDYLLTTNLSDKLHILVGLKDKLHDDVLLESIHDVLDKFNSLKANEATVMKSGIYVVDNTYNAHSSLLEDTESTKHDENKFSEDALHALKELSVQVTDKLSSSKKILKEKWEDLKQLSTEKPVVNEVPIQPNRKSLEEKTTEQNIPIEFDNNAEIIYKVSSQKAIEIDNNINIEKDENEKKTCKSLYQYFRLSLVGKEMDQLNLICLVDKHACDINQIYKLMLSLEQYCLNIGALEESKFIPNNMFLSYLNFSPNKDNLLDLIIKDEDLYKYFVDSCISVNMRTQKLSNLGCECGFPLPFNKTNQTPVFSELIDLFLEKQWPSQTKEQCYEICKRMPYLWRKIIYLRRNEDLQNVLQLLLQMLDENLLHSFLPQFTLETWDKAVQLYAILHANLCLNCNKKFEHISVKETLSWDDIGALVIKSVGGKNAVKTMEKHANLIDPGGLSLKFYHSSVLVALYEQYDSSIPSQLTDTIYSSYEFEDCIEEICNLLRRSSNGKTMNTALPMVVAAKTTHWGLNPITETYRIDSETPEQSRIKNLRINEIIDKMPEVCKGLTDCALCGLPLQNEVLIKDGGLWVFKCGHTFHGACLSLNKVKLCPMCSLT